MIYFANSIYYTVKCGPPSLCNTRLKDADYPTGAEIETQWPIHVPAPCHTGK